ncbi:hypothetical protein HOI83_01925 [Candidatus Uhrbacteria bacterium]|jgi:hypothetical protein|nr:hypothetical protein [Candidatus Uhrbacteria bacterium]
MKPQYFAGMISVSVGAYPGGIIIKDNALYFFLNSSTDNNPVVSNALDAGAAAGGAAGVGMVGAGAWVASKVQRKLFNRVENRIEIDSGDIKDGLDDGLLDRLEGVTDYIRLPVEEVVKISRFISKTNFKLASGKKYYFVPFDPKVKKALKQALSGLEKNLNDNA